MEKETVLTDILNSFKSLEHDDASLLFNPFGKFTDRDKKRYFSISMRKFKLPEDKILIDVLIDEFTQIKEAENIKSKTEIKHKLFSKLAHEFKTPLLVMKSISQEIVEKNNDSEMNILCNQISSISDYVSFLINDIIYYANYNQITLKTEDEIDIDKLFTFSEDVSHALTTILFNSKKKVVTFTEIDRKVYEYKIISNNARLQQVILNFYLQVFR